MSYLEQPSLYGIKVMSTHAHRGSGPSKQLTCLSRGPQYYRPHLQCSYGLYKHRRQIYLNPGVEKQMTIKSNMDKTPNFWELGVKSSSQSSTTSILCVLLLSKLRTLQSDFSPRSFDNYSIIFTKLKK